MGIGQVISDTFRMVKERFGSLLGLWAVYFGITIAFSLAFFVAAAAVGVAGISALESNPLAAGTGMIVLLVVFYLGYLLVAMAQYASMITMASPTRQMTFGDALGAGWRAAPALLLLMVVLGLGYFAVAAVLGGVGAGLSALGDSGAALFGLVLLPVVVWLGCRLSPLFAVVAVEEVRNPFTAIARAWKLTRGYALKIFLVSLIFVVILAAACLVVMLPSIGLLGSMADPAALADAGSAAGPALGGMLLLFLGFLVISVLFNVCYCAFMAVIHATLAGAAGDGAAEVFA